MESAAARREFITDSTPDISRAATQTSSSGSQGESQFPTTRGQYGGRVELVAYDPQWDEQEMHRRFRTVMGVPVGTDTHLVWVDQCAQSDTEPNWRLERN
jgi:hypothetical protein